MARPQNRMSSRLLAQLLGASVAWYQEHQTTLQAELGEEDPTQEASQIAADLESAELELARERKEDKETTAARDASTDQLGVFYRSFRASVDRVLKRHPRRDAILADFGFQPVRNLRSPQRAISALDTVTRALELHRDAFANHPSREVWLAEAARFRAEINAHVEDTVREALETRTIQQRRDALRLQALEIIDDLYSAAQAVEFRSPDPLATLKLLIQTYTSRG